MRKLPAIIVVFLISCLSVPSLHAQIPQIEREALIALYDSTNGDDWTDNSGWKTPPLHTDGFAMPGTECTWARIGCDGGYVYSILLLENNLVGTIPAELGNLSNLITLVLFSNKLTGTIPAELGNLSNLTGLYLDGNQLTGSVPSELGNLSNLQDLNLVSNQLTGTIPAELGNLSNLRNLYLYENQLTGTIPTELGNLSNLKIIYLDENQLTGAIPTELGNLSNLQRLWLHGNQLAGNIPTSLTNLVNLTSTNIGYNALYTADNTLRTFLDSKDPDWAGSQTVAPEGVAVASIDSTSAAITWTPITYTRGSGGYQVYYSTSSGGPYTPFANDTADKTVSQLEVTGLSPSTTYFFVVKTRTDPDYDNQNTVYSEYSAEVSGTTNIAHIPHAEREALIALYDSTNGDDWTDNSGWKTPPLHTDGFAMPGTENTWYGITSDGANTFVFEISLEGNNLNGSIPAELENLTNLQSLFLSSNLLSGSIPAELGNLSNLEVLELYDNQLSGPIPNELGYLTKLQYLMLYENALIGPIPTELGNLTNLKNLDLQNNGLIGSIPTELGNLINLVFLGLSDNQLSGFIPTELGNLTSLQDGLRLKNNSLNGPIPTELGNLTNLKQLALYDNQLSGPIPTALGDLTNLDYLALDDNQLDGSIPAELGNLTKLEGLWLDNNALIGSIPAELGKLTNLESLELFNNLLSGSIPAELGNLTNLQNLLLFNNLLSGSIPTELGNLTNLLRLYLFSNQLSGPIPTSLTNLTSLTHTDIAYNALYTNDNALQTFLDNKDPDWADSQTVAPEAVIVASTDSTSAQITLTPIGYTGGTGGYHAYYSITSGGPYTLLNNTTADKTASRLEVTGLNPGTTYYFVVQTRTDSNSSNQNTVYSEYSAEIVATTLSSAKLSWLPLLLD